MVSFGAATALNFVLLLSSSHLFSQGYTLAERRSPSKVPMQTIAGVSVIDTPLVRDAQTLARAHSNDSLFNHIMRTWLFGAVILNTNESLHNKVDREVHAVASLLHDLGLDITPHSPFVSPDKRFEVDGAIAARDFIRKHKDGRSWEEKRVQLVWDMIALHATFSIADYKEAEVQLIRQGVTVDFTGPAYGVTPEKFADIFTQFPLDDIVSDFNQSIVWLCQNKASSTWDTWMQPWGEHFVANYTTNEHLMFDILNPNAGKE